MKQKKNVYIFLFLAIVSLFLLTVMSQLGRPTREGIKYQRIKQLKNWRQATINYIQQNKIFPEDLYDVYQYEENVKCNIPLSFLVWMSRDKEESLYRGDKIFKNRDMFIEKIEYKFILKDGKWLIQEKNNYPYFLFDREMKRYWRIDQDGNISSVVLCKNSSDNQIE